MSTQVVSCDDTDATVIHTAITIDTSVGLEESTLLGQQSSCVQFLAKRRTLFIRVVTVVIILSLLGIVEAISLDRLGILRTALLALVAESHNQTTAHDRTGGGGASMD